MFVNNIKLNLFKNAYESIYGTHTKRAFNKIFVCLSIWKGWTDFDETFIDRCLMLYGVL